MLRPGKYNIKCQKVINIKSARTTVISTKVITLVSLTIISISLNDCQLEIEYDIFLDVQGCKCQLSGKNYNTHVYYCVLYVLAQFP